MWLLTPEGFFSIVDKGDGRGLCVRARVSSDLDRLRQTYLPALTETVETPDGDYRYRAWATHDYVAALAAIVQDLNYDNFKNEVARRDSSRAHAYHEVWEVLGRLQPDGPYGWNRSR